MKTIQDIMEALDYDTMIKEVYKYRQKQAQAQAQKVVKFRKRRNKWCDLFPVCK